MAVAGRSQPVPAVISRGSLQDFATPVSPAPNIVKAAATPGFGVPGPWLITRASLQDFATPVTPVPVVVATAALHLRLSGAVIVSIPAAPAPAAGAPAPLVVALAVKLAAARPPVISSAPLTASPRNATSTPTVTDRRDGSGGVITSRTSTSGVMARAMSSPAVSDG